MASLDVAAAMDIHFFTPSMTRVTYMDVQMPREAWMPGAAIGLSKE